MTAVPADSTALSEGAHRPDARPDARSEPPLNLSSAAASPAAVADPPADVPATTAAINTFAAEFTPTDAQRVMLHMPVDVRSVALVVLAVLASIFVLHWAREVFIPLLLGIMLSYALSPVVNWFERWHVPRYLTSGVLLLSLMGGSVLTVYALSDDAVELVQTLPTAAQKLRQAVRTIKSPRGGTLETVQKAATQIEQAATESSAPAPSAGRGVTRVVVERAKFNITDYLWTGTLGLMAVLGQGTMVIFLTFFLLASGDTFRRKLVKLTGPTLSSKKITVQALHEVTEQIQRYLQVQLAVSALVGVLTWLALMAIGMENAAVWGVLAGILNLVPYVGAIVIMGASALFAFLQFGTPGMAAAVGSISLVIHLVVGNVLTPWLTSRAGHMNPVAVFVGLLAWGWLWGIWGLLLGIPILMVVKAVCDRVDDLKPVGEFLGS
jgi:predicted PurR-regulated permease PerM